MKNNVGTVDRIFRALIGVLCIVLVFAGPFAEGGWQNTVLAVVGSIMLLTSVFRFCPLYRVLGLSTCTASK